MIQNNKLTLNWLWPGLVVFTVVVVTLAEADVCGVVDPWDIVSLDVWLVVVVSGGRLVWDSGVPAVVWEVSGGGGDDGDDDIFPGVTLECMVVRCCVVALMVFAGELTSVVLIVDKEVTGWAFVVEPVTGLVAGIVGSGVPAERQIAKSDQT